MSHAYAMHTKLITSDHDADTSTSNGLKHAWQNFTAKGLFPLLHCVGDCDEWLVLLQVSYDLLVGADGAGSAVRSALQQIMPANYMRRYKHKQMYSMGRATPSNPEDVPKHAVMQLHTTAAKVCNAKHHMVCAMHVCCNQSPHMV